MKINGKQVKVIKKKHDHLGFIFFISIGKETDYLTKLILMLETVSYSSRFTFCGQMADYKDWLNIYELII